MSPQSAPRSGRSDNAPDYRQVNLARVHQLLKLGYERLDRSGYRTAEEEVISGDLADAIDLVLDEGSHPWMDLFSVHNEAPVSDPRRKGKRRRKVDIRIDSALQRPRTRFPFEAKRLIDAHDEKKYLGEDGLGRFLRGVYARTEAVAGMLGYVQSGEPARWAERIGRALGESARDYCVVDERNWRQTPMVEGLEHTYSSSHVRQRLRSPIDIYHTLLDFSPPSVAVRPAS
jgi:hypothetical protein